MAITAAEGIQRDLLSHLETADFKQAASNATRLVSKLVAAVQKKELYDTHQLLRTIYFRFVNHKDKLKALIDLLYHGAQFLVANREFISGQDVATLFLESSARLLQARLNDAADLPPTSEVKEWVKTKLTNFALPFHRANSTIDLDVCEKVAKLACELPDTETGRSKFMVEALKLLTPKILNRELLHTVLAKTYRGKQDYAEARYHFLHCANTSTAGEIGELLSDYHQKFGNKNEVDIFLAQFVLQFLCMQNLTFDSSSARSLETTFSSRPPLAKKKAIELIIHRYKETHQQLLDEPTPSLKYPLFNFLNFITSILGASPPETQVFKSLCDIYKRVLNRDPNFQCYLDRIGVIYFGLVDRNKQQQQQQGGFFNNILMSLLDTGDDDDEAASPEPESSTMTSYDDLD